MSEDALRGGTGLVLRVGVGPVGHLVHGSPAPLRRGFFLWSAVRPLTLGGKPLSFLVEVVSDCSTPSGVFTGVSGWPTNSGGTSIPIVHARH